MIVSELKSYLLQNSHVSYGSWSWSDDLISCLLCASSNITLLCTSLWIFRSGTGDIGRRICTAAEMKFYFNAFFNKSNNPSYLQPNVNCNLTSWVSGCEPGWGCSVDPTVQVDLQNSKEFPERTKNCMACCEGFFCPRGLTCMIRKQFKTPSLVCKLFSCIWSN